MTQYADNCSFMKWPYKLNLQLSFRQEAALESLELCASQVMFISNYLKNGDHWKFTQRNGIHYSKKNFKYLLSPRIKQFLLELGNVLF